MSRVPWSSIRDWKEQERLKKEREILIATRPAAEEAQEPVQPFEERFQMKKMQERMFFGSIVGGVTGAFFGSLDATNGLKKGEAFGVPLLTSAARAKFAMNHIGTAGAIFSGFYGLYQGGKYIIGEIRNVDDLGNACLATLLIGGPLAISATFRRNIPYATLLVALDVFNDYG